MSDALQLGTLWELEFTPAMHCAAIKLADWPANKGHLSYSVECTQPFTRRRRTNSEAHTPSLKVMGILPGQVFWKTVKIIHQEVCIQRGGSKLLPFSLHAGI